MRSLREMQRQIRDATCLPASLVKAQSLAGSKCEHDWRRQRQDNDWQSFLINFEEVVKLAREEAQARYAAAQQPLASPYDALLDLYCTGDSSELIAEVFTTLKRELPSLIEKILAKQPEETFNLTGKYLIDAQKRLNQVLMEKLGFDFQQGRLDVSSHPFSTGTRGDHRITTRFRETEFFEALMATAHESGHAGYEAGLPEKWDNLPIGSARNMCIHESQSLLFEKQIFLSQPFFKFFTESIHEILPQTKSFSAEQMRAACCRVKPSYIRVEADEVTYPLHVILRFEIEKELINGSAAAKDVPDMWDEKMRHYLGLSTAGNYRDGCLQDIHWTDGSFGYFPSYTMGAINAAQLFETIRQQHTDWQEPLAKGNIGFICDWLQKNIWSMASSMDSQEIIEQATGEKSSAKAFLKHLKNRYLH
jgi:carboxypeptidase Taq